jgi:hypothetical protein
MDAIAVLEDLFSRGHEALAAIVTLSDEELHAEPLPSMAWYAWRAGRSMDYNVSPLVGLDQLWLADGWHAQFEMEPKPRDFQPGFPPPSEVVSMFHAPSGQLLLDYFDAAYARTNILLASLTAADLDRELDEPRYDPLPTMSVRLVSVAFALAQCTSPIRYRMWMAGKGR